MTDSEDEPEPENRLKYKCRMCEYPSDTEWLGPCPNCGKRCDIIPNRLYAGNRKKRTTMASAITSKPRPRLKTMVPEFDRILGDGIVKGHVVLLAGDKGAGKTTLSLQVADAVARNGRPTLFASGEQIEDDIRDTGRRLGLASPSLYIRGNEDGDGGCLPAIFEYIEDMESKPSLVVMDSISAMYFDSKYVDPNAKAVIVFAQSHKIPILLLCQMTKSGDAAGAEELLHNVDVVCFIENVEDNDRKAQTSGLRRLSIPDKNRGGRSGTEAYLEMTDTGLLPLSKRLLKELKLRDKFEQEIGRR